MADVTATLGGDITPFQRAMNAAKNQVDNLGKAAHKTSEEISRGFLNAAAGVASFEGIAQGIEKVLDYSEQVEKLSERFGVSEKALQEFGHAAEQNGESLETVAAGFNRLEVSISRALSGSKAQITAFQQLGISMEDLKKMSPEEVMMRIGKSSMDAGAMVALLGRNGLALNTTLRQLADGSARLGTALDSGTIQTLAEANKELAAFKDQALNLGTVVAATLIRAFKTVSADVAALMVQVKVLFSTVGDVGGDIIHGRFSKVGADLSKGASWSVEAARDAKSQVHDIWNPTKDMPKPTAAVPSGGEGDADDSAGMDAPSTPAIQSGEDSARATSSKSDSLGGGKNTQLLTQIRDEITELNHKLKTI